MTRLSQGCDKVVATPQPCHHLVISVWVGNHTFVKMFLIQCATWIWLLGTFVNSSCDIKINIKIVQNFCRNLTVRGLRTLL